MIKFNEFIKELFIFGIPSLDDKTYIIANNKYVWLLNNKMKLTEFLDILDDFTNKLNYIKLLDIMVSDVIDISPKTIQEDKVYDFYIHHVIKHLIDIKKDDLLVGHIENKDLYLYTKMFLHDPKSSSIIYKIIKQLKLNNIYIAIYKDTNRYEVLFKYKNKEVKDEIPDIAYHGTSSYYLNNILRIGIRPNISPSNYSFIKHKKLIFFTTSILKAKNYAISSAIATNSIPVIIEFKIPDKDMIIADYDIENFSGVSRYYDKNEFHPKEFKSYKNKPDPDKLSKDVGVYGYKHTIKPNSIQYCYVYKYSLKHLDKQNHVSISNFSKYTPKNILNIINVFDLKKGIRNRKGSKK